MTEQIQDTARAKKAVACLYYVSGISMDEIERAMGQVGGTFDGAAEPIRSVKAQLLTSRGMPPAPSTGRITGDCVMRG